MIELMIRVSFSRYEYHDAYGDFFYTHVVQASRGGKEGGRKVQSLD